MKYTVDALHKIAEVQTVFHWDVEFSGKPFDGAVTEHKMRVYTYDLPKPSHAKIDVVTHGYTFPGPGIVNRNGNITLTFFESVTADIVNNMMKWHDNIYSWTDSDVEGKQKVDHSDLFANVTMTLMNKKDEDKQIYTLQRCIITDLDPGGTPSDGNSPDYFKPVLSLEYAWFNWRKA